VNSATISLALIAGAAVALAIFFWRGKQRAEAAHQQLVDRFRGVLDADEERRKVLGLAVREGQEALAKDEAERAARVRNLNQLQDQIVMSTSQVAEFQARVAALQAEFAKLDEESQLQTFGYYQPHYQFSELKQFAERLEQVRTTQKEMLKEKTAGTCAIAWTVNGSATEGRKSINQTLKLMLRAFNGETDAAIARVRYNNIRVMEERIRRAFDVINSLAQVQQCRISEGYRDLRVDELRLVFEYAEKEQEQKEEQRRIREQMRDEEIALRQIERAKEEAEKEEARYERALLKAREEIANAAGEKQVRLQSQIDELQLKLDEAHAEKERAISRAQMTRSGHVYVISNIGSLGEQVFKIGMTRRLDPLDRIKELGDASVPFQFDIHAMIFSEDAPALESALHRSFERDRVNRVNQRKEFFRVDLESIAAAVQQHHGTIEFTMAAEAEEYRKTLAIIEEDQRQAVPADARLSIKAELLLSDDGLAPLTQAPLTTAPAVRDLR